MEEWGGKEGFDLEPFPPADKPVPGAFFRSNALSGGERHRLFMNRHGNFKDLTLVSGADFREDGRGFILFDYDRDGWLDLGVTSPNHPRFRIVKNQFKQFQEKPNGFVEIELIGGQNSNQPTTEWSPRDPFGARVMATINGKQRVFQLSCGEGLSIQNAKRIHIGMGNSEVIEKLEVTWPSGKKTVQEDVAVGQRLTIFENPETQPVSKQD